MTPWRIRSARRARPSCFGQRISHRSSDHKLTPEERAAGLQEIVDSGDPLALELFGPTVSVGEFAGS